MDNNELIKEIHNDLKKQGLSERLTDSTKMFNTVMNNITKNISEGRNVTITNFGTFGSKMRSVRNPSTKEVIQRFVPFLKYSTKIKNALNEKLK